MPYPSLIASLNSNRSSPSECVSIAYCCTQSLELVDDQASLQYVTLQNWLHTFLAAEVSVVNGLQLDKITLDNSCRSSTSLQLKECELVLSVP